MSLNWFEVNTILEELDLTNSHIQKITQPDFKNIIFDIYRPSGREQLLISMDQGAARLHFITKRLKTEVKLQRFAQFLRSKIDSGKIVEVSQPNNQRIVKLKILAGGETFLLWVRLFNPNLILTDENGLILDAFMRRPSQNEVSGGHYWPEFESMPEAKPFSLRDFPPQILEKLPEGKEAPYWQKIEAYYREVKFENDLKLYREQAKRQIAKLIRFTEDKIDLLEDKMLVAENAESYKEMGELIINQIYAIPKGATLFETEDWYHENAPIQIPLDEKLSPSENAEKYFSKYKKAKASAVRLEEELEFLHHQLEERQKQQLWIAETENLHDLKEWLSASKQASSNKINLDKPIPGLQFQSHHFLILVGRTAKENDELLRHHVRGNDMWMHTRDYAGGYVFIKSQPGKTIPLEVLLDAAHFAIHYSKAKSGGEADLYYTHVKYLRRAKNGPLGLVLPTQEKNLHVKIDEKRLSALLGKEN